MFKCVSYGYLGGHEQIFRGHLIRPMPSKKSDDQKLADRANELYWRSKQSVNQIAEAMDLSKSGLYALIRPLPAGGGCPECGEGLVFPNRTTNNKAIASCPGCEYVGDVPAPGSEVAPPKRRAARRRTAGAHPEGKAGSDLQSEPDGSALRKSRGGRSWKSNRVLWGSVLLGIAAGWYVTRRSR